MSTHPILPLYVDDFEAATAHLTPAEDGIYNRLMRLSWRTPGCCLPTDAGWLTRKLRITPAEFDQLAKPILDEFFTVFRGAYIQRRLKAEYDDISRKKSARVAAGKMGGEAKSAKTKGKSASNATILPGDTRASPYPYPYPVKNRSPSIEGDSSIDEEGIGDEVPVLVPIHEQAMAAWNEMAARAGLKQINTMNDTRRAAVKERLGSKGLPLWLEVLERIEKSAFLTGATGWRATFDWTVKRANFIKITEGNYDNEPPSGSSPRGRNGDANREQFLGGLVEALNGSRRGQVGDPPDSDQSDPARRGRADDPDA